MFYTHCKNDCQKIKPAHSMIMKHDFIQRDSYFCEKYSVNCYANSFILNWETFQVHCEANKTCLNPCNSGNAHLLRDSFLYCITQTRIQQPVLQCVFTDIRYYFVTCCSRVYRHQVLVCHVLFTCVETSGTASSRVLRVCTDIRYYFVTCYSRVYWIHKDQVITLIRLVQLEWKAIFQR